MIITRCSSISDVFHFFARTTGFVPAGLETVPKIDMPCIYFSQIENYKGPAFIVVSCVSKDPPFYPHPHNLVGKSKEVSNGICYFKTETEDMVVSFINLGIQCVTRKGVKNSLALRKTLRVDPFNSEYNIIR